MLHACLFVLTLLAQPTVDHPRLWYASAAPLNLDQIPPKPWTNPDGWLQALPIGNGRLGAMVFGGVQVERLQLNEDSLWSGSVHDSDNPEALRALPEIRQLLLQGQYAEAERLTYQKLVCAGPGTGHGSGANVPFGSYQTLGDLVITFDPLGEPRDYRRELDLMTGVATTTFEVGQTIHRREVYASAPARVIIARLTASTPGAISFRARLARPERAVTTPAEPGAQVMRGELESGQADIPGMAFAARLQVVTDGGTITRDGDHVRVSGADAATLIIGARTSYRIPRDEVEPRCAADVRAAASTSTQVLAEQAARDHRALMSRVRLDLGSDPALDALTTDERLRRVSAGATDPGLEALAFQFARHLLVSSSRPGDLPANLQGLWCDHIQAPWNADYHANINIQMNYWAAGPANLNECRQPLLEFIDALQEPGRRTARVHYDCPGWVVHTVTNPWGFTSPGEHPSWGQYTSAAAWLAQDVWEHYEFTRDRESLGRHATAITGAAAFLLDFLVTEPRTGWLVSAPSNSPENAFRTPDGGEARVCFGPTMDAQIARDLFTNAIALGQAIPEHAADTPRIKDALDRLPPTRLGRHGQIMEWFEDFDELEPGHRHMSHLFALHPGRQISPTTAPELAQGARVTLRRRLDAGGGHTGWSRAWIVCFFARLADANAAHDHLRLLLAKSTAPNMLGLHPPFQIDGNFGALAGMCEMLLQSHAGPIGGEPVIQLLPALPDAWLDGSVDALRARGGLAVAIQWRDSMIASATITPAEPNAVESFIVDWPGRAHRSAVLPEGTVGEPTMMGLRLRFHASHPIAITFEPRP